MVIFSQSQLYGDSSLHMPETPPQWMQLSVFIFFFLLKKLVGYNSKCGHVVFNPLISTAILVSTKGMGERG